MIMSLSKEKIVVTVASTLTTIAVATGGAAIVSKAKYDTLNLPKAMSLTKQFNNLEKSNYGKTLEESLFFPKVRQFINDPRNNVLIATSIDQKNGVVIFECFEKNSPDAKKDNSKEHCYNFDAVELYLKMVKEKADANKADANKADANKADANKAPTAAKKAPKAPKAPEAPGGDTEEEPKPEDPTTKTDAANKE